MAGHVLGLALKPHSELDLKVDLQRAMDYILAKQLSDIWTRNCSHALNRFRRFLRQERGLIEVHLAGVDLRHYQEGLPAWLVESLIRYQHLRQANWRPARIQPAIRGFWSQHVRVWRWLLDRYPIQQVNDVKRQHIFDYMDARLAAGYSPKGVNGDVRALHGFLLFLQDMGEQVPRAVLKVPGLKEPDRLPRFLTDEQVVALRDEVERRIARAKAKTVAKVRDAQLDRAAFYLLWQGGLRLGEVEELCLEDMDLPKRRLMVRKGKGLKDRTVYLTNAVVRAIESYLMVRGPGTTDHLLLFRTRPLKKDLVRARIKAIGDEVGVKVTPQQLRHTFATQLVNAGCRITSIQRLLGHRNISTTLVYARVHNQTVAEDYFAAMDVIEKRMEPQPTHLAGQLPPPPVHTRLLALLDSLQGGTSSNGQMEAFQQLRDGILALASC